MIITIDKYQKNKYGDNMNFLDTLKIDLFMFLDIDTGNVYNHLIRMAVKKENRYLTGSLKEEALESGTIGRWGTTPEEGFLNGLMDLDEIRISYTNNGIKLRDLRILKDLEIHKVEEIGKCFNCVLGRTNRKVMDLPIISPEEKLMEEIYPTN